MKRVLALALLFTGQAFAGFRTDTLTASSASIRGYFNVETTDGSNTASILTSSSIVGASPNLFLWTTRTVTPFQGFSFGVGQFQDYVNNGTGLTGELSYGQSAGFEVGLSTMADGTGDFDPPTRFRILRTGNIDFFSTTGGSWLTMNASTASFGVPITVASGTFSQSLNVSGSATIDANGTNNKILNARLSGTSRVFISTGLGQTSSNSDNFYLGLSPSNREYRIGTYDAGGTMFFGRSDSNNSLRFTPSASEVKLNPAAGTIVLAGANVATPGIILAPYEAGGTGVLQIGRRFSDSHPAVGASVEFWTNTGQTIPAWGLKAPGGATFVSSMTANGDIFVSSLTIRGPTRHASKTAAELLTLTPNVIREIWNCSDCTNTFQCISTGTSSGQWAALQATNRTTVCN